MAGEDSADPRQEGQLEPYLCHKLVKQCRRNEIQGQNTCVDVVHDKLVCLTRCSCRNHMAGASFRRVSLSTSFPHVTSYKASQVRAGWAPPRCPGWLCAEASPCDLGPRSLAAFPAVWRSSCCIVYLLVSRFWTDMMVTTDCSGLVLFGLLCLCLLGFF